MEGVRLLRVGIDRPLIAALALALAAACGGTATTLPAQTLPPPRVRLDRPKPAHIAVIVMENKESGDVFGSSEAPYTNGLARRWAVPRQMFAVTHPSLPNYLSLTGGSTFGIDSDCTDCSVSATSVVDQLSRAHLSWRAYMEDLPHSCFTGADAGEYAKRHDPFVYYTRITRNRARCASIVPLSRLRSDERSRALPNFIWISPNVCHDTHDCSVATGDRFLAGLVPGLLRALGPRGLMVLTWDEGSSDDGCCRLASGGHVAAILAGGLARPGARMSTPVDHYSVLQMVEDLFGLPRLRGAACVCTPSLAPLLKR
jgi:hypothetical protein